MNRVNFHTHTSRCHHASGSDDDYALEALVDHYQVLGFSDHTCWNYDSLFQSTIRMKVEEFPGYKRSIQRLKKRYEGRLEIMMGLEAEYYPKYMDWMLDFCIEQGVEYLIFGNHYYMTDELGIYFGHCNPRYVDEYFRTCVEGMKTGMYSYLAHPELVMMNSYILWDEHIEKGFHEICKIAKELDMPLEYNALGMRHNNIHQPAYPHPKFWEIASQYHNKAIIGMDAHNPEALDTKIFDQAYEELSQYDVQIIDYIPRVDFKALRQKQNR